MSLQMDIEKLIEIINSCERYDQLENLKGFIDGLEFETIGDCSRIKQVLITKEKQLQNV